MLHEFLSTLTDDLFYMTGAEDESDIKYKDIVTVTNNKFESVGFDIRDDWCKISIYDVSLLLYRIITKDMRIPLIYLDRGTLTDPRKFVDHVSTLCCSIYDHWFGLPLDRQDINLLKKYLQPEESTVRLSWWGYPDKDIASFYVGGLGIDYELNLDKDTLHELSNNIIRNSKIDRKGVLTLDLNTPLFIMSIWYRSFILNVSLRDFAKDILREASHQFTGAKITSVNIKPYGFNPEGATQKIIEDNYAIKMGNSSYKISEFISALSAEIIKIIEARKSAVPQKQRELILNKINSLLAEDLHESAANKKPMNLYRVYYVQKSDDTSTYKDVPAYSSLQAANYVKKKVWNVYQVTDVQLLETGKLKEAYPEPKKLYSIKDGEATWDSDAQDFIWWDSESKNEPKYASSYKCKMSPKDFLDLTTDRGADALMKGDTFGLGGKFRDLDVDEFNKEKRQPIFLIISFEESLIRTSPDFYRGHFEADVVGHEGRHRMYALMKAGVKEVDVQLKVADTMYFDRMKPYKISKLDLIGQFNRMVKVTVNNPIAMSWNSHMELNPNVENEIIEARKAGMHGACVRKSKLTESKEDRQKFIDKFGQDMVDLFAKSKDRLKNAGISTDMLWHVKNTSPDDMKNILYNLRAKAVKNDGKADMTKIQGKYNYLGSKDGYDVYEPLDVVASMSLGVGTGWCTTGRYGHAGDINFKPSYEDAKKHWDSYTARGVRFFYFLQNGIGKWALALTYQHSDVNMFADMNTYIERCNFELYNQEDLLDYSGLSEIPYDLIGAELLLDKKDTINGLVISDDGKTVLRCYYKVKSVIVPEGITSIDSAAFSQCNIESVTLPNSLTNIRSFAFEFCSSLKSITIPKSVTVIDSYAFKCCDSLELVTILNDSSILLGSHLFYYTENVVVKTNNKKVMEYCKENEIITKPLTAVEESLQEGGKSMEDDNRGEDIREDIEKHDELNPKLWDENGNLKPEVREKILEIAKEFTDGLKEDGIKFDLKDIRLVGSNCSYNYTDKSDLDVHLIMDTDSLECPDDLYPLLYSAYRSLFNGKLDIDFYGIPVELYVETE